jgi:hypothetical protein
MFKLISKDNTSDTYSCSCLFGSIKQTNVKNTSVTQKSADLQQITTCIYAHIGKYMENAIEFRSLRKMNTMNIDFQIVLKANEKLYGKNAHMQIVDGDKVETDIDGTVTHIYSLVKDGVLNTNGQFMKFIRENNSILYLQPLKFVFDRIGILDIQWEMLMEYTPTFWRAKQIHKEFIGKSVYFPFTKAGIKQRTYLCVYSQLLPMLYSNSVIFNRPESLIPMY